MGYLICEKCRNYYQLDEGESSGDYSDTCECGGKLNYYDYIPLNKIYKCPKCGNEDIGFSFKPFGFFCEKCYYKLFFFDKCPVCGYDHIILEKNNLYNRLQLPKVLYYSCPNCRNSFGFYNNIERTPITKDKFFMIRAVGMFIVMLVMAILIFKRQFFP